MAGLLAHRWHHVPGPLSFPGYRRVVLRAALFCLQWRDRAGIAPDFPFKPIMGTLGQFICTTTIQRLLSAAALSGLVKRAPAVTREPAR